MSGKLRSQPIVVQPLVTWHKSEPRLSEQERRQRADQVMTQMVELIHKSFPQVRIDVYDSGPEREDGLVIIHVSDQDVAELVWNSIGDLRTIAWEEGVVVSTGSSIDENAAA